ncbi:MAG: 30S ribosomal protein S10 [Elusimicrobia bacterium]|nr:30S ribosomal protein S10 [Elusimicrobiota bacterium]
MAEEKKQQNNEMDKIRIKLKSSDNSLLDQAVAKIIDAAKRTGAMISGPVLLPRQIRKYTVNRSVHVDKKSREQFEIRTHARLIDIINPNNKTADALNSVDLPSGVEVKLQLYK